MVGFGTRLPHDHGHSEAILEVPAKSAFEQVRVGASPGRVELGEIAVIPGVPSLTTDGVSTTHQGVFCGGPYRGGSGMCMSHAIDPRQCWLTSLAVNRFRMRPSGTLSS